MTKTYFIGTAKEYSPGDTVDEKDFYPDVILVKYSAQKKAEDSGALFGMVYEITHNVDGDVRVPDTIVRFVDWSI